MKKKYYLDLLSYYLQDLPEDVRQDIIDDYEEHFRLGMASGQSEEEVAKNLGQPDQVAQKFLFFNGGGSPKNLPNKEEINESKTRENQAIDPGKWLLIIALLIFFFPMLIGILGGLFGMVTGMFGALLGLFTGGLGQFFSNLLGISQFFLNPQMIDLHPLTKILLNLFLISLIFLLIQVFARLIHWLVQSIRKLYLSYSWRKGQENEK